MTNNQQPREVRLKGTWNSPFCRRVEMALNMKGIVYEYVEQDLRSKSSELLRYNPIYKKVPILVVDGSPIAESPIILEFIDEMWNAGPLIMPKDPYARAVARFWAKFIDDKCMPSLFNAFWGPEEDQETAEVEAITNLKILEDQLRGNKYFGGKNIGYLDLVASFIGYWLDAIQEAAGKRLLTKEVFPELCAWKEEFVNCCIIKENLPPKDRLVAFYKIRIEAAKDLK